MKRSQVDHARTAPGTRLLAIARAWCTPATVSSVFEPLVADWQREWLAAPRPSRPMVRARGAAAFIVTALCLAPQIAWTPLPGPLSRRVGTRLLLMAAVLAATHTAITYSNWQQAPLPLSAWLLRMPTVFTMFLPFALMAAVDAIRCYEPWPDHVQKRAAVKLLVIVTLWMVVGGGWLAPAMNHRWRNAVDSANAGQPVAPLAGVEELSTYELLTLGDHVHPLTAVVRPGERGRELENRLSFALLPILLIWIRWRLLDAGSTGWFVPLPPSVIGAMAIVGVIFSRALTTPFGPSASPRQYVGVTIILLLFGVSLAGPRWSRRVARDGGAG